MSDLRERMLRTLEFHRGGNLDAAAEMYRAMRQSDPNCADAWHLFGVIEHQQGRHLAAIEQIERAVTIDPTVAAYYNNLGLARGAADQRERGLADFQRAIALRPEFVEAYNNLGSSLRELQRLDEAEVQLQTAISLRPNYSNAHYNLGNVYKDRGAFEPAMAMFRRALALDPSSTSAAYNLGNTLQMLGRFEEALEAYRQVLRISPHHAQALNNLGQVYEWLGELSQAETLLREALRADPNFFEVASNLLFLRNYDPDATPEQLLAEHREWAARHMSKIAPRTLHANSREPERKLRIGYISPDFRAHPVPSFLEPVLAHHDRSQFEVFLYSDSPQHDAVSARLKALAAHWREIHRREEKQVEAQILDDGIDLLVDLAGHTSYNRLLLFAMRPAPVQVSYLGYPNTTGLATMDYRLTDAVADPPGEPAAFSETLLRIEGGFCCYQPSVSAPEVSVLPALAAGPITFGSMHVMAKLNARVLDLWSELLQAIPSSKLLVYRSSLVPASQARLAAEFERRGIVGERVQYGCPAAANQGHLAVYQHIDLLLDAFPWSGHTTSCEALWMGVPVVTVRGRRHASRMVASVLTSLGRPEWIAEGPADFVAIAKSLASDVPRLAAIRSSLRREMAASRLCDGAAFTRALELAYRTMWRTWCASAG